MCIRDRYRGAYKIIERLRNATKGEKGGTLWHTQGTGKTLTMMFVIRKMYNSFDLNNYKVCLLYTSNVTIGISR